MKAILCRRYGTPDDLTLEEIDKPVPADDEVVIRVHAASVNPIDRLYKGRPYVLRLMLGLTKPKAKFVGVGRDVAGTVEAVGRNVARFRAGDEVFGASPGAFAEFARAREDKLARKPANVTFEEAAAVPIAGLTALQAARDAAGIEAGQEVLINGAAGGVGTFAVQIAKAFGARVTAVCSSRNVELVRSLGADQVIDYSQQDFTRLPRQFDVLLDCVGNRSLFACCRVVKREGVYVAVGAPNLRHLLYVKASAAFVKPKVKLMMASLKSRDLDTLGEMLERGTMKSVIGTRYSLADVPEAMKVLETRHARGKLVVTI